MIREHEARLIIMGCDFPECHESHEGFVSDAAYRFTEWPKDWRRARIEPSEEPDLEWLTLCPRHAHLADAVALVLSVLDRRP